MNLVDDWRRILRKAWSVRFALIASALQGLAAGSFVLAVFFDPLAFLALSVVLYVAAFVATLAVVPARVVDQPKMRRTYTVWSGVTPAEMERLFTKARGSGESGGASGSGGGNSDAG